MRTLLALVIWFGCCSCLASDAKKPPTGEEVFDLLLKVFAVSLDRTKLIPGSLRCT